MQWKINQKVDLARGYPKFLIWPDVLMLPGDSNAHIWNVEVYEHSKPVDLDNCLITASFERIDGNAVYLEGSAVSNVATVTLDPACYAAQGSLRGIMRISNGDSTTTVCETYFNVRKKIPTDVIDPGSVIPDVDALLLQINATRAAETAANEAAERALLAAADANAASVKNAPAIVCTTSGEAITVSDASDKPLQGLRVFGKTTQDGTPAPDAPADLVNIGGDGSIAVTIEGDEADAQSFSLSTPDGLPGIPVTSGGNYTDASGQQWVCDEIDLERGMYVQRVGRFTADGTEAWYKNSLNTSAPGNITRYALNGAVAANVVSGSTVTFAGFCSHFVPINANAGFNGNTVGVAITASGMLNFYAEHASLSAFSTWLSAQHSAGTPVTVYYILPAPAETPLDAAQIAAYAALHTNKPNTAITNDSGAGMQVDYAADTKIYIDNKFTELAAALVANA